jgi:uncharacterized protein DUF2779
MALHRKHGPRREFSESLLGGLGDHGSIIVYSPFEKTTLNAMAALYPDWVDSIQARIDWVWDLCASMLLQIYHPGCGGSFSIMAVLPVLAPQMRPRAMMLPKARLWWRCGALTVHLLVSPKSSVFARKTRKRGNSIQVQRGRVQEVHRITGSWRHGNRCGRT